MQAIVAAQIQQALLPKTFPPFPDRPEVDLFAIMQPARQVGGDFYDFFWLDHDHLGFTIGDVAGKGVPAAILMAVTRTLVKGYSDTHERGRARYNTLMRLLPQIMETTDPAATLAKLRKAANADDTGRALEAAIGEMRPLAQAAE